MKKKLRRLRLERDTIRNLTPEALHRVAGGDVEYDSRHNSCDSLLYTRPQSYCNSCIEYPTVCC